VETVEKIKKTLKLVEFLKKTWKKIKKEQRSKT